MRRISSAAIIFGLALLIWGADQWSKLRVVTYFEAVGAREIVPVVPGYFDITYVRNTGAAMGLLVGRNVFLTALSVAAIVLLIAFRHSFVTSHREHLLALGLIVGGILGNLTDRLLYGSVVDFLYFHWQDRAHWYVFNIADAAICVGVFAYILALMIPRKKTGAARPSAPAPEGTSAGRREA